jgi:hypothetical protein
VGAGVTCLRRAVFDDAARAARNEEKIKADASAARQSHAATSTHHDKAFEQEAGVKRRGGRTVRGPLPKSKKASAEAAALRNINKGKEAA